jgi:hypothetical protein
MKCREIILQDASRLTKRHTLLTLVIWVLIIDGQAFVNESMIINGDPEYT